MAKVETIWAAKEQLEEGSANRIVHVAGESVSGMDTLCGHVDRVAYRWQPGGKVTCRACLRIWEYVKDHSLP